MEKGWQLPILPTTNVNPAFAYRSLLGILLWIARTTRPDIYFAVVLLCSCAANFNTECVTAAKRVLRYLKGTRSHGLTFSANYTTAAMNLPLKLEIELWVDADWGGDLSTRRSHSGSILALFGNFIICTCRKQDSVALSTFHAELVSLTEGCKDYKCFKNILIEAAARFPDFLTFPESVPINCDNISAVFSSQNREHNKRTRHIDIRYFYIRDMIEQKEVVTQHIPSEENIADIFTKALAAPLYRTFVERLHVLPEPAVPDPTNEEQSDP